MSRSPTQLSELQLDLLRILWEAGEATVNEVHAALSTRRSLAATSVSTLLKRLEKYGHVAHRTLGRQFIYRAVSSEADVKRTLVSELAGGLFSGDVPELLNHLLRAREVRRGDLERIKRMIAEKERELGAEG